MKVKLLAQHVINDRLCQPEEVLDVVYVTPLMEGLDAEATQAISNEIVRVYGIWLAPGVLLDNPPLVRTLDNNRPVPPLQSGGPPR